MSEPVIRNSSEPDDLVAAPQGQLAQSLPPFLGFSVPAAELHSIPLAPEFTALVQSAREENHVDLPLPRLFNPLFRKQGIVNKHTINALESVGDSLRHLAREIEQRDRVLEKLTSHFNSHTEYAHRGQVTVVRFIEQLAAQVQEITSKIQWRLDQEAENAKIRTDQITRQISEVATNLQARVEQEAERDQIRSQSVLATVRGTLRRTSELENQTSECVRQLGAIQCALTKLGGQLSAANAATSDQNEAIRTLGDETRAQITEIRGALADIQTTVAKISAQPEERIARLEELLATTQKTLTQRVDDMSAKHAAEHAETRRQVTLQDKRTGELEKHVALLVTSVSDELRTLAERSSEIEGRCTAQVAASAEATETSRQKVSALKEFVHRSSTTNESWLKAAAAREELILNNARAVQEQQRTLASELEQLRTGLLEITTAHQVIAKRDEETAVTLRGVKSAMDAFLATALATPPQPNSPPQVAAGAQAAVTAAQTAISDAFYVAFEARFRGPQKLIRERQSVYIPLITETLERVTFFPPGPAAPAADPVVPLPPPDGVLDLGSGRGEWLGLLADHRIPALGVDRNQFFVDMCRQKGCSVVPGDLMAYLRVAPAESVAVVTSFHVIEHLPIPVFEEMTRQVFRILRRGGVAIFETPNPSNIITSSFHFLSDPTHIRPVHPDFGKLLLEAAGFSPVSLKFLSPVDPSAHVGAPDDPLAQRFNQLFYGPQDFAIIGIKP